MNLDIKKLLKILSPILILALVFTSCKNKELIQPGDTVVEAYGKAKALYDKEKYLDAAEAFETVFSLARGTQYAQESQYYLAQSYYNRGRYLLAASEFQRYSSLYPRSDRREETDFKEALSYYKLSPRYQIDQRYTRRAIEKFRLYNSRYPNSEKVQEAAEYITELRSKLAHKLFGAAQLYMRTDRYEAAIIYYDLIISDYPESKWAERALVNEIEAYNIYAEKSVRDKQDERYGKAVETYEKYIQLFPNGANRAEAESHVDKARVALANLGPVTQGNNSESGTN